MDLAVEVGPWGGEPGLPSGADLLLNAGEGVEECFGGADESGWCFGLVADPDADLVGVGHVGGAALHEAAGEVLQVAEFGGASDLCCERGCVGGHDGSGVDVEQPCGLVGVARAERVVDSAGVDLASGVEDGEHGGPGGGVLGLVEVVGGDAQPSWVLAAHEAAGEQVELGVLVGYGLEVGHADSSSQRSGLVGCAGMSR